MENKFILSDDEHRRLYEEALAELRKEASEDNNIYDPVFEKEIENRLDKIGEPYKSSFYELRMKREKGNPLSDKELDILNLEAMERSYAYQKNKKR